MLRLRTEGIVAAAGVASPPDLDLPETYNDFVGVGNSTDYSTLNAALAAGEKLLFLRAGTHIINNPILIDTTEPLYIHGFADQKTFLKAQNQGQPLFIIQRCPLLNVQRVGIDCAGAFKNAGNTNQIAFDFRNTLATRVEFAQLTFRGLMCIDAGGPGDYIFQNVNWSTHNMVQAAVIVDHPAASFWHNNGHVFADAFNEHLLSTTEIYHVWQKRGHVEIYNIATVASRGEGADFRFDTRSPEGAHVVAGVRSEGVRNIHYPGGSAHADGLFSHLITVPSTSEQIDIVVVANEVDAAHDLQDPNPALRFCPNIIRYNAAGTLWVFNNTCRQADHVVSGNCPNATIIAGGNNIRRTTSNDVMASVEAFAGNLQHRWSEPDGPTTPPVVFCEGSALLDGFGSLPQPPARAPIPVVKTPRVETLHSFMELVSVTSFGATGNGSTDDSNALQNAINSAGDRLFWPAGTFRTTRQLAHHFVPVASGEPGSTAFHGFAGGWWAGAGRDVTRIRNTAAHSSSNPGRCLITGGMGYYQIQDITFETVTNSIDCVHMSRQTNFSPDVITTRVTISNCEMIGGNTCLGWANDFGIIGGNQSCEAMMAVDCILRDGNTGFTNGRFNAFGNVLFNCQVIDCGRAFSSIQAPCSLIQCTLEGNSMDIGTLCFIRSHYFGSNQSDSPIIWQDSGGFLNDFYSPVWEGCIWTDLNSGSNVLTHIYGAGPAFLKCTLNAGRVLLPNNLGGLARVVLKLWSTIPEWGTSKGLSGQDGQYHEID